MGESSYSDEEVDRAVEALSDPKRFRDAETRVARVAPGLQRILGAALHTGGWLEAHDAQVRQAAATPDEAERTAAVRTLLAEEARMGMLVGVAVGWELARELEGKDRRQGSDR